MSLQGNPLNTFQWRLIIPGLNVISEIEVQKAKVPSLENQPIEVGAGTHNIEYPGKIKTGDLEIEMLKVGILGAADPIYQWFMSCMDYELGTLVQPAGYRKSGQLVLLGADLLTKLAIYEFTELWPKKLEMPELDLKGNELYIEKVVFSVRKFKKVFPAI